MGDSRFELDVRFRMSNRKQDMMKTDPNDSGILMGKQLAATAQQRVWRKENHLG
jgi:hypothetical protein